MHCCKYGAAGHTVRTCERNSTSNAKSHVHPTNEMDDDILENFGVGTSDNTSPCV